MSDLLSSKRFIAFLVSILSVYFKDRLPITEEQLVVILTAIGSLIVGDSINPIGKLADVMRDPRVIAALAAIAVALAKDRLPIQGQDLTNLVYLAASWIVGYSIRPPQIEVKPDPSKDQKAS